MSEKLSREEIQAKLRKPMNRHHRSARRERLRSPLERLSKRIEELTERDGYFSNAAIIRQMREAMFAGVDALQKSGTVKIPQ